MCSEGVQEVQEWQFCEQAMAMEEAFFTGRIYQSFLLAQDGAQRYAMALKDWVHLYKSEAKSLTQRAAAAARSDIKRARAQEKLVRARAAIYSGRSSILKKAQKDLDEVIKEHDGKPEAVEAVHLKNRITRLLPSQ